MYDLYYLYDVYDLYHLYDLYDVYDLYELYDVYELYDLDLPGRAAMPPILNALLILQVGHVAEWGP